MKFSPVLYLLLVLSWNVLAQNSNEPETVHFSIPKTIYFGGERIWIDASAMQGEQSAPSKIIYAELVNRYNESVAIAKMPLEDGVSFNFLQIPTNLPSDNYLLRVFTRISSYQDLAKGLTQRFVTIFNRQVPPTVVRERTRTTSFTSVDSPEIGLSKNEVVVGEQIELKVPRQNQVVEVKVAVENPFLNNQELLPSAEVYSSLEPRDLVPELFGHIIEAKLEDTAVDTTQLYYLSLHGEKSALFTDRPNPSGHLYFDAGGLKHWKYLVAQGHGNKSLLDFTIVSPAPNTSFREGFVFPELLISPADEPLLKELLRGGQVEGYFVNEFDTGLFPVVTGFVEDRVYLLDDYTRFESVETIIKEYVPEVSVKTIKKKKEFRAINEVVSHSFDRNPLMLVDAMPIFDSDLLAKFNPKGFEKLQVLTRTFYLNEEEFPGVMSFSSYKNDFGGFPIPSNGIYLDYQGIQPRIVSTAALFDAPRSDSGIMDWRTVLYWSALPDLDRKDESIQIKVPETRGRFQVTVKAINSDGATKYYSRSFEVK